MKKILALAASLWLLLGLLSGCGSRYKDLRLDIQAPVTSLDPQFTTDPTGRMILKNVMEGLVVQRADGTLEPGAARTYEISPDGRTYTFVLREDAVWENGDPVTAQDFVYAFRRMMNPQVPSPYTGEFSGIAGAREVLAGSLAPEQLGVWAKGDDTLIIELEEASPLFLQRLAGTGALPCNQKFFEGTRARYGMDKVYFLGNGPYHLSKWDNEKAVVLAASQSYWDAGQVKTPSVTLYVGREDPKGKFLGGGSDCYQLAYEDVEALDRGRFSYQTRDNTVWALTFRQTQGPLADTRVRRALVGAIDPAGIAQRVPGKYTLTQSLVPREAVLFQQPYRSQAGIPEPIGFLGDGAMPLLQEWLEEQGQESISGLNLIAPQSADLAALGGYFQRMWQDHLMLYVNLEVLPDEEYRQRLAAGDFQMALAAVSAASDSPQGTLALYLSSATGNAADYRNPEYDRLLAQAITSNRAADAAALYAQAEEMLIRDAVALPLFSEPTYFAMGRGVSGVEFAADGACYLKYAARE